MWQYAGVREQGREERGGCCLMHGQWTNACVAVVLLPNCSFVFLLHAYLLWCCLLHTYIDFGLRRWARYRCILIRPHPNFTDLRYVVE